MCFSFYLYVFFIPGDSKPPRDIISLAIERSRDRVTPGWWRWGEPRTVCFGWCFSVRCPLLDLFVTSWCRIYFIPLRSIWFAAMSMTLMMNAMAKAQIRLLRTQVCFSCWVGLAVERRSRNISTSGLNNAWNKKKLHVTYCQCPRGTPGCSGGSPQSWWCSQCLSWWDGHGKCRRGVS